MRTTTRARRFKKRHWSLDSLDVKILDALAAVGPRNVHEIARKLQIPTETVWYRVKRLHSHFSMFVRANVFHTNIGLRKALLFAEAYPGYEDTLYEAAKTNDYWIYISQCLGSTTFFGVYAIPDPYVEEFKRFASRLEELNLARNTRTFWSTSFQTVNVKPKWFNPDVQSWELDWNKWAEEVKSTDESKLPFTLVDPKSYPQKADYMDIFILKELEKKATIKLSDLAKMLGTSIQNVRYHFETHVVKENLLEGWQILFPHFGKETADTYFFLFSFQNHENLRKFALSLLDKPFARTVGKVFGENQLFVQIYLPRKDFRQFIEVLSKLIRSGVLESHEYVIQDLGRSQRQTISYEFFKDGKWVYNHQEHLERLQGMASKRV